MFAQLFDSAKRILNPASPAQEQPEETAEPKLRRHIDITMVVTRRGAGTDTPRSETATPRSSSRKRIGKRELEGLETPTISAAKRQKKVAPQKKEIEETPEPDAPSPEVAGESSDTIDVAVPELDFSEADKLPIRRRAGSPRVVVAHKPSPPVEDSVADLHDDEEATPTQDNAFHTPEQQASSVYATPATRRKQEASPTPKVKSTKDRTPASAKKSGRKTKPDETTPRALKFVDEIPSSTQESEQTPIASQSAPTTASPLKKAHVRFGSEEPQVDLALLAALQPTPAQPEMNDGDDSASDSDEAPDVVTTASAASKLKLAEADAARARARALQVQQEKERSQRTAREQRLASERAEKLKREEKKAAKLAKALAKQTQHSSSASAQAPTTPLDPHNLPALLPDALLSAIDHARPPTPPPERHAKTDEQRRKEKLNHHIKFLERGDTLPKDVRKGKLSVAVLRGQNKVLPPKANRDSRNVREHWLKGRKVEKRKGGKANFLHSRVERRAHGGGSRGFLRGED
ncbi:hypothetical protein P153DRAFT_399664 [Dothidotthia symphoricarpi CBS 119687]|uniref:Uncharacterized protein n=1 Tax=Dothidotthia symphoricarpi CBS 119687 TaxID=1392245 RepID=A0A6A6A6G4_9PLEO|nr:uncharacterized protein P153DRAFT_399664 [Dothidotthia symphoricarpi CBS 119687]KAF2126211.1 hypothetical protein P153DRAFT_399664 [Dothidotthia symphoricarpi CBS 119687]